MWRNPTPKPRYKIKVEMKKTLPTIFVSIKETRTSITNRQDISNRKGFTSWEFPLVNLGSSYHPKINKNKGVFSTCI